MHPDLFAVMYVGGSANSATFCAMSLLMPVRVHKRSFITCYGYFPQIVQDMLVAPSYSLLVRNLKLVGETAWVVC